MRSDAGDRESLADPASHLDHLLEGDAVDRRDHRVRIDFTVVDDRLMGGVARDGAGVLEGEHEATARVGAGALDLLLARAVAAQLVDDLAHPRVGLEALGRVKACPERQLRRVGEVVVVRPDRVAKAPLLADLVEQPRSHRPAEQCRVDAQRGALARIAGIDRGPVDHPQMRLVGVARFDQRPGHKSRRGLV